MKIDKELLNKTAHLARLEFDENSAEQMMKDMTEIIDWVEKLNEVDTDGVEPLTTMSQEINALREDEPKPHLSHERALENAPKKDADYFRVPKVLN
ncbi:Asp-tRNA(Asn)/Glu-tRNA(Gln) amidotransferase subunit GatC [Fulvivirga sp. RKSG066]|uniref:Asp-tRNA(Asn)/Glu-tRNA(Gln) amidotransferase subunit GatC n=1 Tax=Fulvivirga aurantia TaxID=2529383 RepID=UPI0012BD1038|nr:Asp-tRNA(Asn)/Glu-tRNA(Gln) amidotransferase subunit GatC [Fulvivirga aurantia]MTI22956.1 Asp-tRNA(Asn)/Glu-tRNA(Gln) amidotransferase subunit GatC [Fulvivirga aurantia]